MRVAEFVDIFRSILNGLKKGTTYLFDVSETSVYKTLVNGLINPSFGECLLYKFEYS
jgi:hypothetical protein